LRLLEPQPSPPAGVEPEVRGSPLDFPVIYHDIKNKRWCAERDCHAGWVRAIPPAVNWPAASFSFLSNVRQYVLFNIWTPSGTDVEGRKIPRRCRPASFFITHGSVLLIAREGTWTLMPKAPDPKLVISRSLASSQGLLCPKNGICSRGIVVYRNFKRYRNILKTASMCHSMCRFS